MRRRIMKCGYGHWHAVCLCGWTKRGESWWATVGLARYHVCGHCAPGAVD